MRSARRKIARSALRKASGGDGAAGAGVPRRAGRTGTPRSGASFRASALGCPPGGLVSVGAADPAAPLSAANAGVAAVITRVNARHFISIAAPCSAGPATHERSAPVPPGRLVNERARAVFERPGGGAFIYERA